MINETLRHLDNAIEAVRRAYPTHMMLRELEMCRKTLMRLHFEDDSAVPPMCG
jgi:hypothetical protein